MCRPKSQKVFRRVFHSEQRRIVPPHRAGFAAFSLSRRNDGITSASNFLDG